MMVGGKRLVLYLWTNTVTGKRELNDFTLYFHAAKLTPFPREKKDTSEND